MTRSNETIVVLQALKRVHTEIEELRKDIARCNDALERMEQTGHHHIIMHDFDDEEDGEDTGESESSEDSAQSAPF